MEIHLHNRYLKIMMLTGMLMLLATGLYASSFSDSTISWLSTKGLSPRLIVLIISMLPLIELRGSIPVAIILFKMPWQEAVLLSVLGNMVPIPLLLLLIEWFFAMISKVRLGARFTSWMFARTPGKAKL